MDRKIRFIKLYTHPILLIVLVFLTIGALSCSKGDQGTVAPAIMVDDPFPMTVQNVGFEPGHNLIGVATVYIDTQTLTTQVRYHRTTENHFNLTGFLSHPNCPGSSCMTWKITSYDYENDIYYLDMVMVNPTVYAARDLRVIVTSLPYNPDTDLGWQVLNPDSYTNIWDNDPEYDVDNQWLNPFIAFEKEDLDREFLPDPDGNGPAIYSDKEELELWIPPDSGWGSVGVVIDASWPDHCKEPYEIFEMGQSDDLPPINDTSAVGFECIVADWQQDITDVDLYVEFDDNDTPWDGRFIQMYEWPVSGPNAWPPGDGFPPFTDEEIQFILDYGQYSRDTLRKYWCNVYNEEEIENGTYLSMVVAKSIDTDGEENDTLYNICPFEVAEGGGGGDETQRLIVAFSSYANGTDADIYVYHLLTKQLIQVTNDGGAMSDEIEVTVNANGTHICFASNYDPIDGYSGDVNLYEVELQWNMGGDQLTPAHTNNTGFWTPIADNPDYDERMPDYSPDGNTIAFSQNQNYQWEIYKVAGGLKSRITVNYSSDEFPHFDRSIAAGDWLYFQSNRAGGSNYEIYAIDPNNQESSFNLPTRITFDQGFDGYVSSRGQGGQGICWSSDRDGDMDIMFWNFIDDPVNLTHSTEASPIDAVPSISPDGQWVAFQSDRKDYNLDIWRMRLDMTNIERLTNDSLPDTGPCYGGGI